MESKKYYVVYATPLPQVFVCSFHTGRHPLIPEVLDSLLSNMATELSIKTKVILPKEAIQVINVIEVPSVIGIPELPV